jgi:flagellar protein FliS
MPAPPTETGDEHVATSGAQLRYLTDTVSTATPARLIVMLYDRLGLDLRRAADAFERNARFEAAPHLLHAQQIIAELLSSLRTELWPGGKDLASLYSFLLRELISVNAEGDVERLTAITEITTELRNTWDEAASVTAATNNAENSTAPAGSAIAWVG